MTLVNPNSVTGDVHRKDWELLKITAHMEKPVVRFDDGLCLDGPLQWAAYQMHEPKSELPDPDHEWCVDFEMPVAKWEHGRTHDQPVDELDDRALSAAGHLWGWCISNAQAKWELRDKTHVRKVDPSEDLKRWSQKKAVNKSSGQYKGANKPFPFKYAPTIEWWVIGHAEKLQPYLRKITHLGKLANHGWGKLRATTQGVPGWEIESYGFAREADHSHWKLDGHLIARVPFGFYGCEQKSPSLLSMRAPRWDHRRMAMMMRGKNMMEVAP